ncbi:MAG: hypothetical protein KDJ73_04300 [Notoacmeibacter sp.]|nr:hypothetical protein [Notoacmeibacter sp.]
MFALTIQTALLLAIAFIIGCILGCLLKRLFASDVQDAAVATTAIGATAAAGMAAAPALAEETEAPVAALAEPEPVAPVLEPEPAPLREPEPVALAAMPEPAAPAPAKPRKPAAKKPVARKAAAPKAAIAAVPPARDDLKRIRGIGRQNEARLNAEGISAFAQIASWTKKDQAHWGDRLAFPGRIEREEWVAQAKILAKGKETEFSRRVERGEVQSSTGKGDAGEVGKKPRVLKAARRGKPDNLTLIDGVGNAIEKKLFDLGIFHFDQVAKWSADEAAWVSNAVGFPGRAARENWVTDAARLASGELTDHARRVEQGAIPTSRKSAAVEKGKVAPAKKPAARKTPPKKG